MDRSLHIFVLFHYSVKEMTCFFQKGTSACEKKKSYYRLFYSIFICFQIFHVIYKKEKLPEKMKCSNGGKPHLHTQLGHDVFLEQLSSNTLKVERLERQII